MSAQEPPEQSPPHTPGWYTPQGAPPEKQRYHDGYQWTEHWRDRPKTTSTGVVIIVMILSLLLPIIGVIVGVVYLARGFVGAGLACLVAAGLGWLVAISVIYGA